MWRAQPRKTYSNGRDGDGYDQQESVGDRDVNARYQGLNVADLGRFCPRSAHYCQEGTRSIP
jgi:hypothetical protein